MFSVKIKRNGAESLSDLLHRGRDKRKERGPSYSSSTEKKATKDFILKVRSGRPVTIREKREEDPTLRKRGKWEDKFQMRLPEGALIASTHRGRC